MAFDYSGLQATAVRLISEFGKQATLIKPGQVASRAQVVSSAFGSGEDGGLYDPSDLSTLYQDQIGTAPVTADSDPMGRFEDVSGNFLVLTQDTTSKKPLYRTDGTVSWVQRDGLDDEITITTSIPWGAPTTMILAHRRKTNTAKLGIVLRNTSESSGVGYMQFLERSSGDGNYAFRARSDALSAPNVEVATVASSHPVDEWGIFTGKILQGTTSIQKNNDTAVTAVNAFGAGTSGNVIISIGGASDGDIGALLFVRADLSESARQDAVEWMASLVGITL